MEVFNRKAKYDYEILEEFEAGIVLTGTEIKSIRLGKTNINDGYCLIRNSEVLIINMHISLYEQGNIFNHSETRSRKLLLNKKEILTLKTGVERMGNAIVPLKLYFKNNRLKVLIALAKGKKSFDKRETTKKRDIDREIRRNFKNKV